MTEADRRPIAARNTRPVVAMAGWLVRHRASPDAVSVAGMVSGCLAGFAFAMTGTGALAMWWLIGAALVQGRLLANLLDGMVAVGRGVASPLGELFNEVPDRVSDTAVLIGFGAAAGSLAWGLAAAGAAMATAYVRAVGRGVGLPSDFRGPMAKQHRMALVTAAAMLCAIWPGRAVDVAWWALVVITLLSLITALRRLLGLGRALRP